MISTRREIMQAISAAFTLPKWARAAGPNSVFGGVHIGVIAPYSFRGLPGSAEDILKYLVELGISTVELQSQPVETYAGAPSIGGPMGPPPGGRPPGAPKPGGAAAGAPQRPPLTPEQQEARRKAMEELWKWRLSAPMDKFRALRRLYNDAGVTINAFKLELSPNMSAEQCAYVFNVARALGATHVTMELSLDPAVTKAIGEMAERHRFYVAYHNHTQVKADSWDTALSQSSYNGINLDVGHYVAATGESPIPLIRKYHGRILSLHLKDRKTPANGAANVAWGQGDTPLKEILQLMKREKYRFPANIELEYPVPAGSTVMAEIARCVEFARQALS